MTTTFTPNACNIFSRHKFLIIYGQSQRKVEIQAHATGATKIQLTKAAADLFGLKEESLIIQAFDKDFEDYVNVEDDETVEGPAKLRITVEEPVVFPVTINVNQGDIQTVQTICNEERKELAEAISDPVEKVSVPLAPECPEVVDVIADTDWSFPTHESPGRSTTGWITTFSVPVQPPSIETKLKLGGDALNEAERSIFLESIYSAITKGYGEYYPTKTQYDAIIEKTFAKYPLMRKSSSMPLGNKKMLWKHRLQYKFQNKRKRGELQIEAVQKKKLKTERKKRSPQPSLRTAPPQWGMKNYLPERPASEDDTTIATHIAWMKAEKKKRQPDYRTVTCCLEKTLADRRKWIVSSSNKPSMAQVQNQYPWLFDVDQLSEEMQRIKDDNAPLEKSLKDGLHKYTSALIQKGKARRRPHTFFLEAVTAVNLVRAEEAIKDASLTAAFLAIPGLLQEDIEDIFLHVGKETTNPVYVRMDGSTPSKTEVFKVIADGEDVASCSSFMSAAATWITAFYVFNLDYPTCISKSLSFLQRIILNIYDELPAARSIISLTNKLNTANCK